MSLHFPTLGLVLLTVGILTSIIMLIIWRMYRQMEGPGFWATAAVLTTLGFLPMWLEPWIGNFAIILNNFATITTPLLIFEGAVRFRKLHLFDTVRVPGEFLLVLVYMLSTIVNLHDIRSRYLINDVLMMLVLALTIAVLLWHQKGLERIVYLLIASTFALMFIAFAIRWTSILMQKQDGGDPNSALTTVIFFTLVPWAIGWSYGFVLVINIKGRQTLYDTAHTDPLTGLSNRLWMVERFDTLVRTMGTMEERIFCLTILDINGFKSINDKHGHLYGDAVLRHVGTCILQLLEKGDYCVRYGGDEFILLLTCERDGGHLDNKLTRIISSLETPVTLEDIPLNLSMSHGSAVYPIDGTTSDELFKVADQRMYGQKRARSST